MLEGIFRIAYTGKQGNGLGVLLFQKGTIVGADSGGGIYDGFYTENADTGATDLTITLTLAAGAIPVTTGIPLATPRSTEIKTSLRQDAINGEKPTLVLSELGPVNLLFKKLRDLP